MVTGVLGLGEEEGVPAGPQAGGGLSQGPSVPSADLDGRFPAGQGGRAPCVKWRVAADLGDGKREKGGCWPVWHWEQVAGRGCQGRASRRRTPAGLVSLARPAAVDTAPGSPATRPPAALPRADEAPGRLAASRAACKAARSRALGLGDPPPGPRAPEAGAPPARGRAGAPEATE